MSSPWISQFYILHSERQQFSWLCMNNILLRQGSEILRDPRVFLKINFLCLFWNRWVYHSKKKCSILHRFSNFHSFFDFFTDIYPIFPKITPIFRLFTDFFDFHSQFLRQLYRFLSNDLPLAWNHPQAYNLPQNIDCIPTIVNTSFLLMII